MVSSSRPSGNDRIVSDEATYANLDKTNVSSDQTILPSVLDSDIDKHYLPEPKPKKKDKTFDFDGWDGAF